MNDKIGVAIGFTDPVFRKQFKERHGKEVEDDLHTAAAEWTSTVFPATSHGWEDLKFLRDHWDGPIILKGIQTVEDAKMAVKYKAPAIILSNHGGRNLDGSPSGF